MVAMASVTQSLMLQSFVDPNIKPQFVDQVDQKFHCERCKKILYTAYQTACGHRICSSCRDYYTGLSSPEVCPGGEGDCSVIVAEQTQPDPGIKRDIGRLLVYCINKDNGCTDKIKLKDFSKHVDECLHSRRVCPNAKKGCSVVLKSKDELDSHVSAQCEYIERKCEFCRGNFTLPNLAKHIIECPMKPVDCPLKCGTRIVHGKIDEHKKTCPNKTNECPFRWAGCEVICTTAATLESHMCDPKGLIDHMLLMNHCLSQNNLQMDKLKNNITVCEEKINVVENSTRDSGKNDHDITTIKTTLENNKKSLARLDARNFDLEELLSKKASKSDTEKIIQETNSHKIKVDTMENRISNMETSMIQGTSGIPANIKQKLRRHDELLSLHEVTLSEMDIRFQCIETGSTNGVLLWKIREYKSRRDEARSGKTLSLYSQPFYTSKFGYKMCARIYLNGDGVGKGTHMSLFFVIMRGEYDDLLKWPFAQRITLSLIDPNNPTRLHSDTFVPNPRSSSFKKPVAEMNVASGCPLFIKKADLENSSFIVDDTIYIKLTVDLENCSSA